MIIIHICICRFFSMTWVLMCHTYGIYELTIPVNNMTEIYDVSLEILCPGGLVLHFVNVYDSLRTSNKTSPSFSEKFRLEF